MVRVYEKAKRYMVEIRFRWPEDRSVYRERVRSPVPSKSASVRWGEDRERALLLAGRGARSPQPEPKEVPTFAAFVETQWWNTYPAAAKNRPATLREKRKHLDLHLLPELGATRLNAIDRRTIDTFFSSLTKKGLSPKYTRNIGGTLHKILATAVDWDVIERVPRFPKIRLVDPEWNWFTGDETRLLLSKARDPEEYALLLFPFDTGARAGEQLGLQWGDLDFQNRKVVFRRSVSEGILGPTKTGKSRHVPLTAALLEALRAIKHLRGQNVFCNRDGSPLTLWQLHERIEGACRRAGLRRIRWHDTRHSFASQLVSAGVPLRQVQEYLGHTTIAMTMRYSHLAPNDGGDMRRALARGKDGARVAVEGDRRAVS